MDLNRQAPTLEKFYRDLGDQKPYTLIFPHIPKTGGTTLLYHFRKNLGDNNVLIHGPHNRKIQFFADLPQLEEMSPKDTRQYRVVQGHGVSENTIYHLRQNNHKLIVVLRHPVALTRSRFSHLSTSLVQRGKTITTSAFLARQKSNFMTRYLLSKFPGFVDSEAKSLRDRIVSVLRKFDYVFTTEKLDMQVKNLACDLDLPDRLERRRVTAKTLPLDIADDEILRQNVVDLEIFQIANGDFSANFGYNPFGFDAVGQRAAIDACLAKTRSANNDPADIYQQLAISLCNDLSAEAALSKLADPTDVTLNNPLVFKEILQTKWNDTVPTLNPEQVKISKRKLSNWIQSSKK